MVWELGFWVLGFGFKGFCLGSGVWCLGSMGCKDYHLGLSIKGFMVRSLGVRL